MDEQPQGRKLSRGQLIRRGGALAAVAAVGAPAVAPPAPAEAEELLTSRLKALSAAEAQTLEAVLERLIPTDATGPGAKEANVLRYIDWSLAGELALFKGPYSSALAAVDAYSVLKFGGAFASLPATQQDAVLTDMESDKATGFTPGSSAAFEMIRGHAMQGMFGDPVHGGNVGFVGWKLARFPGPRLVVSAHDQKLDVVPQNHLASTYSSKLFKHTKVRT